MTAYTKGAHEIGDRLFAYTQPDGGWGWSNAGLIVDGDRSLLVDTLFDLHLTAEMLDALRRTTAAAEEIDVLVNTHANGDHCYGNQLVSGARVIASRACAEEMSEVPAGRLATMVEAAPAMGAAGEYFATIFGPFDFTGIDVPPPDETFEGTLALSVGDRVVELFEVGPAHTMGDVVVHVPDAGAVFTGDILFNGGHPIVWAGPVENWVAACRRIADLNPAVVVPGHGPVTDVSAVVALQRYFEDLTDHARRCYEAGLSPFEAAREAKLDVADGWGQPERLVINVTALYRDFGGDPPSDLVTLFGQMAELAGYG